MSLTVDIHKQLGRFSLDASFRADGGTLGLLGASGSGKSLTLKCIAGIERPDRGKILLNGVTLFDSERWINLPPQKRRVGYLFQNYALFPNMTVRQNILCGIRWERDRARRAAELRRVVELLHLQGLEEQRPDQLSGGQQQRTALARILVSRPELLMLDEPFSALDEHLRDQLQIQMKKLLDAKRPALSTSLAPSFLLMLLPAPCPYMKPKACKTAMRVNTMPVAPLALAPSWLTK
jgi:molybdate transport system ATP-binding protein